MSMSPPPRTSSSPKAGVSQAWARPPSSWTQRELALGSQSGLQTMTTGLRTLLERFANGQSMYVVFDAADALIKDAKNDEGLREWFKSVDAYLRKVRSLVVTKMICSLTQRRFSLMLATSSSPTATTTVTPDNKCITCGSGITVSARRSYEESHYLRAL